MTTHAITEKRNTGLMARMGQQYGVDPSKLTTTLKHTAFRQRDGEVSNEQLMALMIVADQHHLNPFTKEIYAFPDRSGIVPVVSVDGWAKIINDHPAFDGMEFSSEDTEDGKPYSCTCTIYRKDRSRPISVTEYFDEVVRPTGPWKSHPRRMLRHKTMIQAARLAFSFSGIYDPDEAESIHDARVVAGELHQVKDPEQYPQDRFEQNLPKWGSIIESGQKTSDEIIGMVESKATLTDKMKDQIRAFGQVGKRFVNEETGEIVDAEFTQEANDED